jgi:hypothetical protein
LSNSFSTQASETPFDSFKFSSIGTHEGIEPFNCDEEMPEVEVQIVNDG